MRELELSDLSPAVRSQMQLALQTNPPELQVVHVLPRVHGCLPSLPFHRGFCVVGKTEFIAYRVNCGLLLLHICIVSFLRLTKAKHK